MRLKVNPQGIAWPLQEVKVGDRVRVTFIGEYMPREGVVISKSEQDCGYMVRTNITTDVASLAFTVWSNDKYPPKVERLLATPARDARGRFIRNSKWFEVVE